MMIPTVFTASKGLEIFYSDIYCEYFRPLFYKSTTISYLLKSCQRPVPSAPMCRCPWFQTYEVSSSSVCVCCNSNVSLPYSNQVTWVMSIRCVEGGWKEVIHFQGNKTFNVAFYYLNFLFAYACVLFINIFCKVNSCISIHA